MRSLRLILLSLGGFFLVAYLLLVGFLYFSQDSLIFQATKLSSDYKFDYPANFEEINIPVDEEVKLNALLFKADNPKGVVFYLHGNGGCLDTWGNIASTYTDLGYDIFIPDYRGYGKSNGHIESEDQFVKDIKLVYAELLNRYDESKVVIIGYSIGTGTATILAAANHPKALVLKAPYYSLTEIINSRMPFMPDFLQKYKFETYKYLKNVKSPIYMFHGTADGIIPYNNSIKLQQYTGDKANLTILEGEGHLINGDNMQYREKLAEILK